MRSIFGRINVNEKVIDKTLFDKSIEELSAFVDTKTVTFIESNRGFGQVFFPNFQENLTLNTEANYILISDSAIYNKEHLAKELDIKDNYTDDSIILSAFDKWGYDCVNYLMGDFAFAIWNKETQELFCARDHLGVKPFNYYFNANTFVFSSDISAILAQMDLDFTLDEQQIADTLSIIKSEKFRSSYQEIQKLPPAHYLTLKDGKLELKKYWKLEPQNINRQRDIEVINEFKNLLIESVKCRLSNIPNAGAELSGGIDSSSVTAIASQFTQIKTFSHILPDNQLGKIHPFTDERKFINLLTEYCQIQDRNFISSEESLLKAIKEHVKDFKSLSQQNFGVFSDQLYKTAMHENISVLLSGFGGDEIVTSQSAEYIKELASINNWEELKIDLRNQYLKTPKYFSSIVKIYLKSNFSSIYMIYRFFKFQKSWQKKRFKTLALNPIFKKSLRIKRRYINYYKKLKTNSLQEKNNERITHPHVSQRLEYCSLIARKYGIEYRYPLLDIRLIEFYLSVPPRLKARNGIGRYIIRRAIEGIVPEKIQWRNDKSGATIPTVFMRMLNDKEEIQQLIEQAKTNEQVRTYIDLEKYEQWFHKLCNRPKEDKFINPGAFYNYLKLIFFIEQNPSFFK